MIYDNIDTGTKLLINLPCGICAPNGKYYNSIFGTINGNYKYHISIGKSSKVLIPHDCIVYIIETDKLKNTEKIDTIFNADEE